MEQVVLLAADGSPTGSAPKRSVHTHDTPLHLAFSCYLFDPDGRLLLTRRALSKATWPGVWTNSFCGHPGPGENLSAALHRRVRQELGVALSDLRLALPDFRYRAVDANGIVENEICPVYTAVVGDDQLLSPDPDEVAEWEWVRPDDLAESVTRTPFAFSPWLVLQLPRLLAQRGT